MGRENWKPGRVPGSLLRPVVAHLRDLQSGDTRAYATELYVEDDYDGIFIWEDGNFACDCNRSLFLWDWDDTPGHRLPCHDPAHPDGRIVVAIRDAETNELLYSDDPDVPWEAP